MVFFILYIWLVSFKGMGVGVFTTGIYNLQEEKGRRAGQRYISNC